MLVDLIRLTAADGMELDGAFFAPAADAAPVGPIDAVLCVHGSGGLSTRRPRPTWPTTCGTRDMPR